MSRAEATKPESAGPGWRLALRLLARLPQPALSRLTGRLADVPLPAFLRGPLLGTFARIAGIDVEEAELPLREYRSFDAFFVRRLRDGVRDWPSESGRVGSPVDGCFGECGTIEYGRMVQAKGRWYTAAELLADSGEAGRFEGGSFVTLYLSPRHYHRIHAPTAGGIHNLRRVPGALLPVNRPAVVDVDRLFPRNERAVCVMDGPAGRVAVVAVGAFNVGRITASFIGRAGNGGAQVTNFRGGQTRHWAFDPAIPVTLGEEIMAFHLGSTVILLFEGDRVELTPSVVTGAEVKLGSTIAVFHSEK